MPNLLAILGAGAHVTTGDTENPTCEITSPADGLLTNDATQTVSGTASDNVAVAKVEVRINGGSWVEATGTTNWSYDATLSAGSNTIEARATDTSLNVSAVDSISVSVDLTNPVCSITTPADGATTNSTAVSGTASDNVAVSKVEVRINGGTWQTATGTTNWSYTATLNQGSNTIEAQATDTAGNTSSIDSHTITYDNVAPSCTITDPTASETTNSAAIAGTASDASPSSGLLKVQVSFNGTTWYDATGTSNWTYDATGKLTQGSNTVYAKATDNAGNVTSPVASVTFTYDTVAPTISWVVSADGLTWTGTTSEAVALSGGSAPGDKFTFKIKTVAKTPSSVVLTDSTHITATFASPNYVGKNNGAPTTAYNAAAAGTKIVDQAGNEIVTYSDTAATNNSKMLVVDTFTDTNGTLLVNHVPSELNDAGGSYAAVWGTPEIRSNHLEDGCGVIQTNESNVVMQLTTSDGANYFCVRHTANNNYWACYANIAAPYLELWTNINGSWTKVAYTSHTKTSPETATLTASGNTITLSQGTDSVQVTNSFNNTATKHGPGSSETGANSADDFSIRTV